MVKENIGKEIIFGNDNYTIYRVGDWKHDYKLNVTGTSSQLPASEPTKKHVLSQMEQIRKAEKENQRDASKKGKKKEEWKQ